MPNTVTCPTCKGKGSYEALITPHDDKTELITCEACKGTGAINQMTNEEEQDYYENNW